MKEMTVLKEEADSKGASLVRFIHASHASIN
jgi:hypothetical protein